MAPPLHFGPFSLDIAAAQLRRDGTALALRPKAFELLVALAKRPGELVTKDELLDTVWGRRFISEGVIKSAISELRSALGEDPKQPRWIETVARRGYRFALAGDVLHAPLTATAGAPADSTASHGTAAAPAPVPERPGNLPASLAPTIGRDAELAALAKLLAEQRLVTIAGPSGIGKTSIAQALAAAQRPLWRDGVWFVELAPLAAEGTDAATLCATLVQTLQLNAGAARSSADLARALQPLALLLVLDNAEHLLAPLSPLVATLLAQAPLLRVVVTSQEPLRIPGEQLFRLTPLGVPLHSDDASAKRLMDSSAVRLFVERVASRMPGFALAPRQQQAVADICRALDGLPLALELAAARVPVLGVHGIAELLLVGNADDQSAGRLNLLSQGARTATARQRTLRDALHWSHGLLDDRQQRVFRRLGVFRGGFTLEAAQAVCADDTLDAWGVLDMVHALVEKSLLVSAGGSGDGEDGDQSLAPRFKLLESLRAFALERLAEAGETDATRRRHLQAVIAYWQRADARALSDPAMPWLAQHLPEVDNLRTALRWTGAAHLDPADSARADAGLALVASSAMLWHRAGLEGEGRRWCEAMRPRAALTADAALRRGFELAVAVLAFYASAYPPAAAAIEARRLAGEFEQSGDTVRAYFTLHLAYQLSVRAQNQDDRPALLAWMKALEQPGWSEMLTRYRRTAAGYALRLAGHHAEYLAYCRDELARCRRLGAVAESWTAAHGLMLAEHDLGRADIALDVGRQALDEIRAAGRLRQHAVLFALWTTMLAESGDCAGTRAALAELLPALRSTGQPWMAHVALVWLAAHEGRADDAARLLGWHDKAQLTQNRAGSGGYIAGSLKALTTLLQGRLDVDTLARCRDDGGSLGDEGAERLAMAGAA